LGVCIQYYEIVGEHGKITLVFWQSLAVQELARARVIENIENNSE